MTTEEIRCAVDAAIGNKVLLTYPQLILFILLSGVAAYLGAYLKKKGENLATKEDVNELTKEVEEIKEIYAKKLEDYRFEIETRRKAEGVAYYLSTLFSNPDEKSDKLNQQAWELSLWLNTEVYRKLAVTVVEKQDIQSYKELLIEIRKILLKDEAGELTWDNIIHHMDE